ncbi:cytochrome D1 domain-containing protein [Amphritea balenae]|uniref:Cytochrome c-552/4 domain-containing protein n=1 Tax=Amphritea balenae TaxID=452629 RepID=A0A3P1SPU1_9GAMM|nr:cytochrome D1 domain-containing protein [Amphritea balenae]RRC98994.1 hypothetical protein EHS89_12565 [Amphritea balenae]GGK63513.1 hypothetical protein GCM10007941_12080 [Amphritea balenae]
MNALLRIFTLLSFVLCTTSFAAQSSSSILASADQQYIYTANFDAGSISRSSGTSEQGDKAFKEISLGQDIRRIALSSDGKRLAATDYLGDRIYLLNAANLELIKTIDTGRRPFALIYDTKHQLFWATLFEANKLIAFDNEGTIRNEVDTADTPRGLALTDDGRLLVSHAMTGQISIYDTTSLALTLIKRIDLAEKQYTDEFVSQGLPRLLDDIAISPDGKEAWLPHLLWNFDHPFQFQSTVFPAVSLIDLTPGQEAEKTELRKELFRQINTIENANRTRIVSNPADAEFSNDGKRLYITLAGSEDLMVIDLSRRSTKPKKKRSKRRQGKKQQGGAKVTQILRHIPGDNPRGLLVQGDRLLVQNAMSQDVVLLDGSGTGPFARVKILQAPLYKTVKQDPLSEELRLGTRLFNSANTDDFPDTPIAGDFWMSCNSCHLDGFNFTNRYLMADGRRYRDSFEDAVTGHRDVITMFAGKPLAAIADVIQKTQGGLGAEGNETGPVTVNPQQLSPEVRVLMSALKAYTTKQENLPFLSTWLRLDSSNKTVHKSEWLNSASCAECHTDIYQQWANSNHGAMMDHPYYRFQENYAAAQEGEEFRALCRGCHFPQALLSGEPMPQETMANMHEKDGISLQQALEDQNPVVEAGTSCFFCHRINRAENAGGNADLTINLKDRESYLFDTKIDGVNRWLTSRMINAKPEAHKDSYSDPKLYQDSLYCATCHNEFTSGPGAMINDNYGEWLASSFNNPKDPSKNRTCIDCHMAPDIKRIGEQIPGISTEGGPEKANVRTHHFTGANNYLAGLRSDEHRRLSDDLLKSAASLDLAISEDQLIVTVANVNGGHHLPGGSRRQLWLEVKVTDASGRSVFENGILSDDGRVPDDARKFHKVGADRHGKKVGLSFWRYEKLIEDTRIPADSSRDERYQLPQGLAYPLTVKTRLLFQAFSRQLTDKVRAAFPEENIPYAQVIEMQSISRSFQLADKQIKGTTSMKTATNH